MLNATPGALKAVVAKRSNLFRNELGGTIRGITAKLHVSPGAQPRFYRPRSIPYALRSRVDQALEKLVSDGILAAVQFSEWAAPIVPVVKRHGSIRVCGDYKLTVNQVAQVDTYPLPLVRDIFALLANGKLFTKLDLANAYQQLPLNEDSCPYTTINTHRDICAYPSVCQQPPQSSSASWSHFWEIYRMSAFISMTFLSLESRKQLTCRI